MSAIDFQLSSNTSSPFPTMTYRPSEPLRPPPAPLTALILKSEEGIAQMPLGRNHERCTNNDRTKTHDRSPRKSVIFDPNICHQLNGINKLSATHTHPPFRRSRPLQPRRYTKMNSVHDGHRSTNHHRRHRRPDPRRHQLLPSVERHGAVPDSSRLSAAQKLVSSRFRPDRADHPDLPVGRIAAATPDRPLHGPPAQALFPDHRNGAWAGGPCK